MIGGGWQSSNRFRDAEFFRKRAGQAVYSATSKTLCDNGERMKCSLFCNVASKYYFKALMGNQLAVAPTIF
jgi:hypothetical protein